MIARYHSKRDDAWGQRHALSLDIEALEDHLGDLSRPAAGDRLPPVVDLGRLAGRGMGQDRRGDTERAQ